ncbi:MAG: D-alanyl-D-alanine carboxypeptidase family protein [Rickettsiales bacterium]
MLQRWSWLAVSAMLVVSAFGVAVQAQDNPPSAEAEASSEAGLDLTLRTKAAAMPLSVLDGSSFESTASHIYLSDFNTGTVLAQKAGDEKMYPSSMTKMMTLYIVFQQLKEGALTLADSQFTVSEKAWRMQGSKMFVPLGTSIPLEDLIRGIAIQSGNDACVVVAEGIACSEEAFAKLMNDTAKKLGMTHTNFVDASGWPHTDHVTTAHDLNLLATAIIRDFPQYYHYLSEREFTFHGIRQFNRNLLLGNAEMHVDGLKTGHTEAAGYGITLSAQDPTSKRRLVLVINGLESDAARAQEGERLLKWGFTNFKNTKAYAADQGLTNAKVFMGEAKEVPLTIASDVVITAPKSAAASIKGSVTYNSPLIAPVTKGQEVGKLNITFADGSTKEVPVIAANDVAKLPWLARVGRALGL